MSATVFILGDVESAAQALAGAAGLRVVVGDASAAARERLLAMQPEVVVLVEGDGLGARGPGADGIALAREVRGQLVPTARVVVVGGARTTMRAVMEASDLGGVRFLRKPVDAGTLRFAVQSSLEEGRFGAPTTTFQAEYTSPGSLAANLGVRAATPSRSTKRHATIPPGMLSARIDAAVSAAMPDGDVDALVRAGAEPTIARRVTSHGFAALGDPRAMPTYGGVAGDALEAATRGGGPLTPTATPMATRAAHTQSGIGSARAAAALAKAESMLGAAADADMSMPEIALADLVGATASSPALPPPLPRVTAPMPIPVVPGVTPATPVPVAQRVTAPMAVAVPFAAPAPEPERADGVPPAREPEPEPTDGVPPAREPERASGEPPAPERTAVLPPEPEPEPEPERTAVLPPEPAPERTAESAPEPRPAGAAEAIAGAAEAIADAAEANADATKAPLRDDQRFRTGPTLITPKLSPEEAAALAASEAVAAPPMPAQPPPTAAPPSAPEAASPSTPEAASPQKITLRGPAAIARVAVSRISDINPTPRRAITELPAPAPPEQSWPAAARDDDASDDDSHTPVPTGEDEPPRARPEATQAPEEPAEPPPWRERTLVLGAPDPDGPALAAAQVAQAAPVRREHMHAEGGTFARELRKTISAIEQRLFPNEQASAADGRDDDVTHSDIDLDSLGVDTTPGIDVDLGPQDLTLAGRRDPADLDLPRRAGSAPGLDDPDVSVVDLPLHRRVPTHVTNATPGREPTPALAFVAAPTPGPIERGNLADEDAAFLLARLHRTRFTGRVTLRRGEGDQRQEKTVFLDDGRPVFAVSSTQHDRMGELLLREGKITRAQLDRAQALVLETGRRMGEILVDMGFLKARELFPAVRRHIEDIVYSLFAWSDGEFALMASAAVPGERIRLSIHPAALVLEGVRRKVGKRGLATRVGGATAIIEPRHGEGGGAVVDADLSAEERRAYDLCDGSRTLGEVAAKSGLGEIALAQLAYALIALGAARSKHSGTMEPEPSAAGLGATRESELAIDRERVRAKYAHVLEADYFTVLGVRQDATAFEVRRAYEAARRDYGRDGLAPELVHELGGKLDDIALVVEEAYRVLRDDQMRSSYLDHLLPL